MQITEKIQQYFNANGYKLAVPVHQFVSIVSNYYHEVESKEYNKRHKTMFNVSSKYWDLVIANNIKQFNDNITFLDYGCGTGFATKKILESKLSSKINKIICYDLSQHMVNECKKTILSTNTNKNIEFLFLYGKQGFEELKRNSVNVLVTNALLHHLLDLKSFFNFVDSNLVKGGVYIAGHEPNANYYENEELISTTKHFQKYKRIISKLSLNYILKKLNLKKATFSNIIELTNKRLLTEKLVNKPIPNTILPKLVDIHVPIGIGTQQVWGESGFTPHKIINKYSRNLKQISFVSYFHIKDYKAYDSNYWKRKMKLLERKFPNDGADCIMMFKKQ